MCFPLCLRRHCCFIQISRGPRVLPSFPTRRSSDLFAQQVSGLAVVTPSMVQRLDLHPRFSVPFSFAGWSVTAMAGLRATYYSNSIDPSTRLILARDVVRGYGEFELDVRPPALARSFRHSDGAFFFRHVIE